MEYGTLSKQMTSYKIYTNNLVYEIYRISIVSIRKVKGGFI